MLRSLSAANMLGLIAAALRGGGSFARRRKVDGRRRRGAGRDPPYAPVPYQVDGDYLGDTDHLEFRWEPAHLRLIVPRPLSRGAHQLTCEFPYLGCRSLAFAFVALYAVETLR